MEETKNDANTAQQPAAGKIEEKGNGFNIPFGLVAIFIAALIVGFAIANPGFGLLGNGAGAASCAGNGILAAQPGSPSVANLAAVQNNSPGSSGSDSAVQVINMTVSGGWSPNSFVLKNGVKTRWVINGVSLNGCNDEIIVPTLGLDIKLHSGENIVEFTPNSTGVIRWHCGMNMLQGTFVVVNDPSNQAEIASTSAAAPAPAKSGGCGCGMMGGGSGSCGR